MSRYGDGSACKGSDGSRCDLGYCAKRANGGMPSCPKVGEAAFSNFRAERKCWLHLACPKGQKRYGDGSACRGGGKPTCELGWCNGSPNGGRSCAPVLNAAGRKHALATTTHAKANLNQCWNMLPCPHGQKRYGDGSACRGGGRPSCDLGWCAGRPNRLPRCVPHSGFLCWKQLPCPAGMTRYGDGSACKGPGGKRCDLGYCAKRANRGMPSCPKVGQAAFSVKYKKKSVKPYRFLRHSLHGQALAQATCTALNTRGGWTFAVRRSCGAGRRTCAQVCHDRRGRSRDGQAPNLRCFNSLHIYANQASTKTGQVGLKVYKYGNCGGGCGPNYCCCRNSATEDEEEEALDTEEMPAIAADADAEAENGVEDSKALALTDVAAEETEGEVEARLPVRNFLSYGLTGQVLAQSTCTAINPRGGWTWAVRRTCGSRTTCAALCASKRPHIRFPIEAFNSLHVYGNKESSGVDQLGLKTYRYNGAGGGCGPNYCCCRNGARRRSEDEETDVQTGDIAAETDVAGLLTDLEESVNEMAEDEHDGVINTKEAETENESTSDLEVSQTMGFQVRPFSRYNLDGQILAQAVCSAMGPHGWTYAVRRPCSNKAPSCAAICAGTTESQAKRAGNQRLQCFNALHIYGRQPTTRENHRGLQVYKYNSCGGSYCGPNYCCCHGSYGARKLPKIYTVPHRA